MQKKWSLKVWNLVLNFFNSRSHNFLYFIIRIPKWWNQSYKSIKKNKLPHYSLSIIIFLEPKSNKRKFFQVLTKKLENPRKNPPGGNERKDEKKCQQGKVRQVLGNQVSRMPPNVLTNNHPMSSACQNSPWLIPIALISKNPGVAGKKKKITNNLSRSLTDYTTNYQSSFPRTKHANNPVTHPSHV